MVLPRGVQPSDYKVQYYAHNHNIKSTMDIESRFYLRVSRYTLLSMVTIVYDVYESVNREGLDEPEHKHSCTRLYSGVDHLI